MGSTQRAFPKEAHLPKHKNRKNRKMQVRGAKGAHGQKQGLDIGLLKSQRLFASRDATTHGNMKGSAAFTLTDKVEEP